MRILVLMTLMCVKFGSVWSQTPKYVVRVSTKARDSVISRYLSAQHVTPYEMESEIDPTLGEHVEVIFFDEQGMPLDQGKAHISQKILEKIKANYKNPQTGETMRDVCGRQGDVFARVLRTGAEYYKTRYPQKQNNKPKRTTVVDKKKTQQGSQTKTGDSQSTNVPGTVVAAPQEYVPESNTTGTPTPPSSSTVEDIEETPPCEDVITQWNTIQSQYDQRLLTRRIAKQQFKALRAQNPSCLYYNKAHWRNAGWKLLAGGALIAIIDVVTDGKLNAFGIFSRTNDVNNGPSDPTPHHNADLVEHHNAD